MSTEPCPHCGTIHRPDEDTYTHVHFRGKVYRAPFKCLCCDKEICGPQFAYGRYCGPCDMGACNPANRSYRPEYAHA